MNDLAVAAHDATQLVALWSRLANKIFTFSKSEPNEALTSIFTFHKRTYIRPIRSVELAGILIAPHESEGGLRLEAQRKQNAKTSVNTLDEELLRKKKQQLQTVVKAKVFSVNYSVFGNNDRLVIVGPCWAEEAGVAVV